MLRLLASPVVAFAIVAFSTLAQESAQRGTIQSIDPAKQTVTITAGGEDHTLTVTPETRLVDSGGTAIKDGLKDERLRAGAAVAFRAERRDGRRILLGLRLAPDGDRGDPGEEIRRARIKRLDLDQMTLTLVVAGSERALRIDQQTQVLGARGKDLKERLREFKEGDEVLFKAGKKEGKDILLGLKAAGDTNAARAPTIARVDTSRWKPLTELAQGEYQGSEGGLYPGGKNERPAAHEAAGVALARSVQPLDGDGKPNASGKIVLLSVGMSNTTQEFSTFKQRADADPERNAKLVVVDGAQGGMAAAQIQDPDDNATGTRYWATVDERLRAAGVTRRQVQAAWIKQADIRPTQPFPKHVKILEEELVRIVHVLHDRFPNLKLAYLSSRTYGGYARTPLNPEPYAYESGFAVKWLIERQMSDDAALRYDASRGVAAAPWLSWGPYLWANGTTPRDDGFLYEEADFGPDGTHPSPSGRRKVAELLLGFFKSDTTTRPWFVHTAPKESASE